MAETRCAPRGGRDTGLSAGRVPVTPGACEIWFCAGSGLVAVVFLVSILSPLAAAVA